MITEVDGILYDALASLKEAEGINSNNNLAKRLSIAPSILSTWYSKPGIKISEKVSKRISPILQEYYHDDISLDEKVVKELSRFKNETDDAYIMAKLASELCELKELVPYGLRNLQSPQRERLKAILDNLALMI